MHLTGVVTKLDPSVFYDRLIQNRISENDIKLRDDGTTIKKLSVIEDVMDFKKMAQMTGDYNGGRPKLITDKLVGNIRASMGFIGTSSANYFPNTVLNGDMRDDILKSEKIIVILSKKKSDKAYNKIVKECKTSDDVKNALEKARKKFLIDPQLYDWDDKTNHNKAWLNYFSDSITINTTKSSHSFTCENFFYCAGGAIHANGIDIGIYTSDFENEYISLTDIARYKSDEPKDVVKNWLRSKDTIEFLGLWEKLHNPNFKGGRIRLL